VWSRPNRQEVIDMRRMKIMNSVRVILSELSNKEVTMKFDFKCGKLQEKKKGYE